MRFARTIGLLALATISGCATTSNTASDWNDLLESDQQWAAAAESGDIQTLQAFWADDAVNLFPGAPVARGKQQILELVRRNRQTPGFSLRWTPEEGEVAESGDLGYTWGSFEMTRTDPETGSPVIKRGHYTCVWSKQDDGQWQCVLESTIFTRER